MISDQKSMISAQKSMISDQKSMISDHKSMIFMPQNARRREPGEQEPVHTAPPFDGETPVYKAARGSTPPSFSSQAPLIPSPRARAARDAAETNINININITMASRRGPGPTIAPRELQLIRSGGHPPLSDHIPPLTGIRERGMYP